MNKLIPEPIRPRIARAKEPKKADHKFVLLEIKNKPKFTPKEANLLLDDLEQIYKKGKLRKDQYHNYRELLVSKIKAEEQQPQIVSTFTREPESLEIDRNHELSPSEVLAERNKEKTNLNLSETFEDGSKAMYYLKKSGAIRLILFVVLAVVLLLFVTKSGLGGISNSTVLLFLIVFVILFIIGKDGEKPLFDGEGNV